jgi:predicted metal-dependent RNase
MKLEFHGAVQTTTGSMHLIEANGMRILLDCGLYQGSRKESFERNRQLGVDAATIDAVLLSHAHIDHCGNLPTLVRRGFRGKIYCTPATMELCEVLLRDSAFLQSRDLQFVNKKRAAQGKNLFEPLYEMDDVDAVLRQMVAEPLKREIDLGNNVGAMFHNAGHILGSALVQVDVKPANGRSQRVLFTGDLGQPNQPILRDYDLPQGADIVLIESTYADREHPSAEDVKGRLKGFIEDIHQQKSRLLIPAFSVGRTQQILYYLNRLMEEKRIPLTPVYDRSAKMATDLYKTFEEVNRKGKELYGSDIFDHVAKKGDAFIANLKTMAQDAAQGKPVNSRTCTGPAFAIYHYLDSSILKGDGDGVVAKRIADRRSAFKRKLVASLKRVASNEENLYDGETFDSPKQAAGKGQELAKKNKEKYVVVKLTDTGKYAAIPDFDLMTFDNVQMLFDIK